MIFFFLFLTIVTITTLYYDYKINVKEENKKRD